MCDTFVVLDNRSLSGYPIFGKNSDRDPNEPQIFVFIDNKGKYKEKIKTTYIEIEPYEVKYSIFLSKPIWIWGGEMGINEANVSIGNEAVFTKVKYRDSGLTGMDMIRIALETSGSSFEALQKILEINEKYGQGGNCGYEKKIKYHNSFLISDKNEAYILEIVDKYYAYKKISSYYNISNKLSIGKDFNEIHTGLKKVNNFEMFFSNRLYTLFSGAMYREKRGKELLEKECKHTIESFIKILSDRYATKGSDPNVALRVRDIASMRNICMIGGGGLISSQTTASMIVEYGEKNIIWFTISPNPEISLFKPTFFTDQTNPLNINNEKNLIKRWKLNNLFFRKFIENYEENSLKLQSLKEENQKKIFELIKGKDLNKLDTQQLNYITKRSFEIEDNYREEGFKLMESTRKRRYFYFTKYWHKENKKLFSKEDDETLKEIYKKILNL